MDIIEKRIVRTRCRLCIMNLATSLALLLIIEGFGGDTQNSLFLVFGLWQLLLYGWLSLSELRSNGLNIMAILFVGAIMSMAYPSVSYAQLLLDGKKIYYGDYHDISDFVFHTSVALNVYFSLLYLFITFFTKKKLFIIDIGIVARRFNLFYVCIGVYIVAFILRLVPFLELFSSMLASMAGSLPMLVLLLLALYCGFNPIHDRYYRLFILLIGIEVFYTMFFGFYKGAVVRAAIMYLLYYYVHCRTIGKKLISVQSFALAAGFMIFLLYIVYPFITIRRVETGFGANSIITELPRVDNLDILKRVLTFDYSSNMISDDGNSSALNDRLSTVGPSTFFYRDAYRNGFHTELIRHSLQVMIPRFLNPNKQPGSAGAMAVSYTRYGYFDPECDTAESVGLFASAYFWGGWLAAILMCIFTALSVSILLNVCFSNLQNLLSWLVIFYLIFSFLMSFKETADGGYSQNIMFLVYATMIYLTSKLFDKRRNKSKIFNKRYDNYKNAF